MEENELSKNTCELEEDIKILEEEIQEFKEFEKKYKLKRIHKGTEGKSRIQALENLIARYKELKEKNALLLANNNGYYDLKKYVKENYIPKSKVKEKIEELNDINSKFSQRVIKSKEVYLTELVQNILQELLEENIDKHYGCLTGIVNRLTDTVEIIEEEQGIDIQEIEEIKDVFIEISTCGEDVKYLARKYNEVVKAIKQLDKRINNK